MLWYWLQFLLQNCIAHETNNEFVLLCALSGTCAHQIKLHICCHSVYVSIFIFYRCFFYSLHSSTVHETAQPDSVPKVHKTMGKPNHHWLWLRSQEKKTITTSLSHTISARVLFFFSFSAEAMIAARGTVTTATRNEMTRNGKKNEIKWMEESCMLIRPNEHPNAMQTECRIHVPNRKTCITSTTYRFRGLRKIVSQVVIIEWWCACVNCSLGSFYYCCTHIVNLYTLAALRLFVDYFS